MELTLQSDVELVKELYGKSHNPCFYGINFAIFEEEEFFSLLNGHNPCFYGINFAILESASFSSIVSTSQSLFLWN